MSHPFNQHPLFYAFQPPSSFEIPNFQNSFLDNLSSIMQNSSQVEEENSTIVQLVETSDEEQQQPSPNENGSGSGSDNENSGSGSGSENENSGSSSGSESENDSGSGNEQEDDKEAALLQAYNLLQQLQNRKKQEKHAKVVPIVSNKKSVKFQPEEEEEDVREIEIPDQGVAEEKETRSPEEEELQGLVRQLVLLETEESKAQQFLEYIQKFSCFDKQDQMLVRHFLEQIYYEKKSLIVVLNNYGTHIQPLITMMSIAERRLTLLDQTNLITPDSTLHTSLIDKQKQLQAIIDEACDHIFRK